MTKPNTFAHNRGASVATLRWCSGSSRYAVGLHFGIGVQLRRNPHTEQPDCGSIEFGANVRIASVEQDALHADLDRSALDVCGASANARTLLACLKLRPDRLNQPLRELSGGERTKVALARVLDSGANLLLLDEPTNHLEIEAQEALEQALNRYPGTLIVVSHDRSFLQSVGSDAAYLEVGTIGSEAR